MEQAEDMTLRGALQTVFVGLGIWGIVRRRPWMVAGGLVGLAACGPPPSFITSSGVAWWLNGEPYTQAQAESVEQLLIKRLGSAANFNGVEVHFREAVSCKHTQRPACYTPETTTVEIQGDIAKRQYGWTSRDYAHELLHHALFLATADVDRYHTHHWWQIEDMVPHDFEPTLVVTRRR